MKYWRWALSAAVIVLLVIAARHVNWAVTWSTLRTASPGVVALAIAVNLASVALRGPRWWLFLRRAGDVGLGVATRGAIVGAGFNNLLVANGGDATRALLVAKSSGVSRTTVVATLALDRVFDPVCFGLLLFIGTLLFPLPGDIARAGPLAGVALVVVALLLGWLVWSRPEAIDGDLAAAVGWRARLREFRTQVRVLSTPAAFAGALAVSVVIWVLQVTTFALVATSVGISLPVAGSVAAMLLTNTGLILRATPGNVGYFQFAYSVAVSPFGVGADSAVAAAVLLQAIQIVPVTILAVALAPRLLRGER